jgi:16S rRNA (guanine527-N7)-methyltransferase
MIASRWAAKNSMPDIVKWRRMLNAGASAFNLQFSDKQIERFYQHMTALIAWSQKTNLTAISDPYEMAIKHFVDSIAPLSYCRAMTRVLDMGSGGGFPGLPIKIWHPDIQLTMVDAVRKKVSFLKHVVRLMGVENVQAFHMRVEDIPRNPEIAAFDTIVCRAFGSLKYIVECARPLMSPKGQLLIWKGRRPEKELQALRSVIKSPSGDLWFRVASYRLPVIEAQRTLVVIGTQIDD